jgi:putative transposase
LSRLFRRLMLERLAAAYEQGRLILEGSLARLTSPAAFAAVLKPLRRTNWFVYAKRPFAGPKAVLAYLSRYTHRVAISNTRLIAHDEHGVTFRYKDYRADGLARHKVMTLAAHEFIRRFLLHILPKGFHRIRHYDLFANTGRAANIARLRELLGSAPPAEKVASPSQDERAETVLPPCPCCGGRMIVIEYFERGTQPRYRPPLAAVIWFDTS